MDSQTLNIIYATFGGLIPALFWLWYWMKEDKLFPEPKIYIAGTFILGAIFVLVAKEAQEFFFHILGARVYSLEVMLKLDFVLTIGVIVVCAFIEEILKSMSV